MSGIEFGKTKEGNTVTKYLLKNKNGMEVAVMDLGATIVSVLVPDREGVNRDVVLGYDTSQEYQDHTCYFGAVIGRNANRIGGAKVVLDGKEYQLEKNDNGNNLHSGKNGFNSVIWNVEQQKEDEITFSYLSKDLEQDFPGNMTAKVTYTVTDDNALSIAYEAVSDQTTVANFTNHAYFNLNGHDSGCMENQELEILASYYTPVKDGETPELQGQRMSQVLTFPSMPCSRQTKMRAETDWRIPFISAVQTCSMNCRNWRRAANSMMLLS